MRGPASFDPEMMNYLILISAWMCALLPLRAGADEYVRVNERYEYALSGIQEDTGRYNVVIIRDKIRKKSVSVRCWGYLNAPRWAISEGGKSIAYYDDALRKIAIFDVDEDEGLLLRMAEQKPDEVFNEVSWFHGKRIDTILAIRLRWRGQALEVLLEERPGVDNPIKVRYDYGGDRSVISNVQLGSVFETLQGGTLPKVDPKIWEEK